MCFCRGYGRYRVRRLVVHGGRRRNSRGGGGGLGVGCRDGSFEKKETEEQRKLFNKFKNAFIKRLQLLWGDEVMKHRNTRRWYRYC